MITKFHLLFFNIYSCAIDPCNTKIWRGMRHQVFAHLIPMFSATFVKITIGHMRSRFQVRSSGSRICSRRVQNEKWSWGFLKQGQGPVSVHATC